MLKANRDKIAISKKAKVISLILPLIALIWLLTGCIAAKDEQWRDGGRIIAHQQE